MPKHLKTKDIFYSYEVDITELQSSYFYENLWYDTEDYKRIWTLHCAFSAGVWFASILLGIFVYHYCALLIIPAMLWYHYSNWQYQNWKTQARQYTTLIGRADMYQWRLLNTMEDTELDEMSQEVFNTIVFQAHMMKIHDHNYELPTWIARGLERRKGRSIEIDT